jgi:hypothetical protein
MENICQGNIVIEILMDRRKKILADNTCVKNDGFITVTIGLMGVVELWL